MFEAEQLHDVVLWYSTPMALPFTRQLRASAVVYDCMDELSLFKDPPPGLRELERELLATADVVFTGGQSLYAAKRHLHANIHAMPSSVDREHFAQARTLDWEPADQASIPHPRAGFFGVIDERMDLQLLAELAERRPRLQIVMVGPVVKIDPETLPRRPNLHWLGARSYAELPAYIAGWDVALLPFARNESTRFISPTKTPEYLAAGRPVVSTSIQDVVRPYGEEGLSRIADSPADFAEAIDAALAEDGGIRRDKADRFLSSMSWDRTFARMRKLIESSIQGRSILEKGSKAQAVAK
jgi:UDP-galactopyranose mutase